MFKRTIVLSLFLVLTAPIWAQEIPGPITSYYEDWNYVVRNSTAHERAAIWSSYRRHESSALSGAQQELLVRMNRIVEATAPQYYAMPMLLAGTSTPVSSEILAPSGHRSSGKSELLLQVSAMQIVGHGAERARRSILRVFDPGTRLLRMCEYTDRWILRDGQWKVLRSPAMWVGWG